MTPASSLVLGLVLGLRHATDPDHVVAMSTIVTRDPHVNRAIRTGLFWGMGHTATVLFIGILMLVAKVRVPAPLIDLMDFVVASMLVGLGIVALRAQEVHTHPHLVERLLLSPLRPLAVGIVHGLAGSAAMTLLALATLRDEAAALVYLGLFGVGTVVGMVAITGLLALSLRWVGARGAAVPVWIARASGAVSVGAGLLLAFRIILPLTTHAHSMLLHH